MYRTIAIRKNAFHNPFHTRVAPVLLPSVFTNKTKIARRTISMAHSTELSRGYLAGRVMTLIEASAEAVTRCGVKGEKAIVVIAKLCTCGIVRRGYSKEKKYRGACQIRTHQRCLLKDTKEPTLNDKASVMPITKSAKKKRDN